MVVLYKVNKAVQTTNVVEIVAFFKFCYYIIIFFCDRNVVDDKWK